MVTNSKEKSFFLIIIIIIIELQIMLRTLIHGARQIVTVTWNKDEKFLCGKDMQNIGIIKSNKDDLSLMIEK